MVRWESLTSIQNLKLAWRRINTATNMQHKRFFREAYLVYESSLNDNLRALRRELLAGSWQPSHATRLYLPKPSGLQRPLSLLGIEDQILLQAIANIFAYKLRAKRQQVELNSVFSNKLDQDSKSIFFTEHWQETYKAFQDRCRDVYKRGYRWAAEFDLAAYYDTISHDLLLNIAAPRNAHPGTSDLIRDWLRIWSADNLTAATGHGIPQGPVASDFLAEAFFLPVDLHLQKRGFQYLRYVDDIRLFGQTENEVRKAAILLEQECRHRGLIPQSTKFQVTEVKSEKQVMGALPSIPPREQGEGQPKMTTSTAKRLLEESISGKPLKIHDKTRFRYVMYRAPADTNILDRALLLLQRHPEHIDAFVGYFNNYGKRKRIARVALKYLASALPYTYVRGELWHLVARLGSAEELGNGLALARLDAKNRGNCVLLSWGVMHFLIRCEQEKLCRLGNTLSSEDPLSRSLLAPIIPDKDFCSGGIARKLVRGSTIEQLAVARELQNRSTTLTSLGLRQRDLGEVCKNSLWALGVIRRRHRRADRDWIGEQLGKLYQCREVSIWRAILGSEYEHALQLLIEAKTRYQGAYSEWLSLQDSFNDIMVRHLMAFLRNHNLPGHSKTIDKHGNLVSYGQLLAVNSPFDKHYPDVSSRLREMHDRRNRLPGSHPYEQKGGSRNRFLRRRERDNLTDKLRVAVNEVGNLVESRL